MRATASPRALLATPRQLDVLRARCETGSRKAAATALGISSETVRWHLTRLFARWGCLDEAQACYRHYDKLRPHLLEATSSGEGPTSSQSATSKGRRPRSAIAETLKRSRCTEASRPLGPLPESVEPTGPY